MPISIESRMSRPHCDYRPQSGRFLMECDFSKQYHHYYKKRLEMTRPKLEASCRQKWDPSLPVYTLAEVANPKTNKCIVIGTLFKRMKAQPDVIEELSRGNFDINSESYPGHYASPEDTLILEDSEESIQLSGNIDPQQLVTGITLALLGTPMNDGGQFLVEDICFVEPGNQIFNESLTRFQARTDVKPVYLLVVSSLGFHHDMEKRTKLMRALQDMIDFVWGGEKFSNDERSSRVARILVVGNSLHPDRFSSLEDEDATVNDKNEIALKLKQSRQVKPYAESIQAAKHMDDFFAQLSKTIDVDIMPGPSDPSSHLMPQQPFHPCMFPKSSMFPTFNCTTNPHHATYNDVEVLATSGQNVDIIRKFSGVSDPIEIMKWHLKWGSSAPSAPDNLFSAPYEDEDPFVIDSTPDIYIAGSQESFGFDYYVRDKKKHDEMRTLLLTVPEFHKTLSCVLVDLESLEPQLLSFN